MPDATLLIVATAAVFLCGAVMTDIRSQIIPNKLNLVFFVCASATVSAVAAAKGDTASIARACAAAALLFGAFWLLHAVSKQGLGGGDVKLAPSLGLIPRFLLMASRHVGHPARLPPKRPSRRHCSGCQFPEVKFPLILSTLAPAKAPPHPKPSPSPPP